MKNKIYINALVGTLREPLNIDETTLNYQMSSYEAVPVLAEGEWFTISLQEEFYIEVVKVIATDPINRTMEVVRGFENTTQQSWLEETTWGTRLTATDAASFNDKQDALTVEDVKDLYESNPDTNVFTDVEKTKLGGIAAGAQKNVAPLDVLTSTDATKALSAKQGKALKDHIDAINALLQSDDTTLDELQEIVDFIKLNRADLDSLSISSISGLSTALGNKVDKISDHALYPNVDKTKLSGIATGATKNATDAQLRDRTTHTGEQPISSVTGLQTALDEKVDKAQNLNDLPNKTTARNNLGLGSAAVADLGTSAASAARGNHTHSQYWDIVNPTGYAPTGDMNNFSAGQGGYVRYDATNPNAPQTGLDVVTKAQYGSSDLLQIAYPQRDVERLLMRTKSSSGWGDWLEFFHTSNILTTTGQSTEYPMSQKAVTDALNTITNRIEEISLAEINYNYLTGVTTNIGSGPNGVHINMRRCLLLDNGVVNYYLNEFDSSLKEDGTPADLSGVDGQVMVEIPRFWCSVQTIGVLLKIKVSLLPLPGLVLHPAFKSGDTEHSYIYVGAYNATVLNTALNSIIPGLNLDNNTSRVDLSVDILCSLSGGDNYAMVGLNLEEFRMMARNRGEGWQVWDYYTWQAIQILGYTELGTFNGQEVLGNGNVSKSYLGSSVNQGDSPHTLNGASNHLGNGSGSTNDFMTYRGIENLWGNCWQWADGVLFNNYQTYVCDDPANYSSALTSAYNLVGEPFDDFPTGSYITEFQEISNSVLLIPKTGSGNSGQFVGDGFWNNSGLRGAVVGGSANLGAPCGFAALDALAPSGRNRYRGCRIMLKK